MHDPWKTLFNQYLVPEEMCGKKMNGQTDSHTDTYTHPVGRTKFRFQVFKILLLIDDFAHDLHILKFKIDIVIFSIFLRFKFFQQPRHSCAYQWLDSAI